MKKEIIEWEVRDGDNMEKKWSQENYNLFLTMLLILLEVASSMAIDSSIWKSSKRQKLILALWSQSMLPRKEQVLEHSGVILISYLVSIRNLILTSAMRWKSKP